MDKSALLLTRPLKSAHAFLDALAPEVLRDVEVCLSPLLEIVPLGVTPDLASYRGVIFTSVNAVERVEQGDGRIAYCVGAQTAQRAMSRGWQVSETAQTADDLVAALAGSGAAAPLLHIAGEHRRGDVDERLTAKGLRTDVVAVYEQRLASLSSDAHRLLRSDMRVIVPLFSPRTARQFMQEGADMQGVTVIAISGAVAEQIDPVRVKALHIAAAPTSAEMRRTVEMMLRKDSLP